MSIEPKYLIEEGPAGKDQKVDFPSYFLDLLLGDERFSSFVIAAKLPGEKEYRDARRFSQIGKAAVMFMGTPLEKIAEDPFWAEAGLIHYQGCSVNGTGIRLGKWWAYTIYGTPELRQGQFGNVVFRPRTEGFFGSKRTVGVEIKGDDQKVPGLSDIRKDKDLLDKILTLFKSDLVAYIDYKGNLGGNEIRFSVIRNPFRWIGGGKEQYGIIEMGLRTRLKKIQEKGVNYASLCKTSFEIANRIADHLKRNGAFKRFT